MIYEKLMAWIFFNM